MISLNVKLNNTLVLKNPKPVMILIISVATNNMIRSIIYADNRTKKPAYVNCCSSEAELKLFCIIH